MTKHPSGVLLQALRDGEVGERRRAALEAHVDGCALCLSKISELDQLSRGFANAMAVVDGAGEPALQRLAAGGAPRPINPPAPWLRAALIAGILAGTTAVAGVSAMWLRERLAEDMPVTATAEAVPVASGLSILAGPNGVRIELSGMAAGSHVGIALVGSDSVSLDIMSTSPVRYGDRAGALTAAVDGRADVILSVPGSGEATVVVNGVVRARARAGVLDIAPADPAITVESIVR